MRPGQGTPSLLTHEGDERNIAIDLKPASLLAGVAGVAGALNAAGFQAAGFFSANMTGNVSSLSDYLGLGQLGLAGVFAALVFAFIAGAFLSGLLIEPGRKRRVKGISAYSILLEALLLMGLAGADVLLPAVQSGPPLVLGLSFIMGLQNAATTRISDARVRTTHVSGMATDVGLTLVSLATSVDSRPSAGSRLRLYAATLAAFFCGGIAGVVCYLQVGGYFLAITGVLLLAKAVPELRRSRTG